MEFGNRCNASYFDNRLSAEVLEILNGLQFQNEEERSFIERVFRFMKLSRFDARDFSSTLAWVLKVLPSRLLPSAWGGIIPAVTIAGRHQRINEYIANNPWYSLGAHPHLLDLGCGFPPITTIELSSRFPNARVTGADPAFASEIVYDAEGNYACFDSHQELPRYFQLATGDAKRWQEMFADMEATKTAFAELRKYLHSKETTDDPRGRFILNPMREYETERRSFRQAGFLEFEMRDLDVIRSFNVLLYYTAAYRQKVLEWIPSMLQDGGLFICGTDWHLSTQARYTVYQKERSVLHEREFAFSVDNIRPLGIVSWFALHDDEPDTLRMCELVGQLRSNPMFCVAYDQRLDELLLQYELIRRNSEGYAEVIDPLLPPLESQRRLQEIFETLEKEEFAARAVSVLRANGVNASVNSVGHIAVSAGKV